MKNTSPTNTQLLISGIKKKNSTKKSVELTLAWHENYQMFHLSCLSCVW